MAVIHIRPARRSDVAVILQFIIDLAIYEKAEDEVTATVDDISRTLFDEPQSCVALICEIDGQTAGFAVYFSSYSTWLGRHGIYLEDLYVSPEYRGLGAGRQMLQEVAKAGVAQGCRRLEWSVLNWNQPAIRLYDAVGGQPQTEWTRYRLAGDDLIEFAQTGSWLPTA